MKRRPPAQNVRRVRAIDGNMRYSVVNKCLHTVQCESFQEYTLVLLLERDRSVKDYISQPEQLTYRPVNGRETRYTPDFQVWYTDGRVAWHEVTIQHRRNTDTQRQREQAAQIICQERGWRYVVHTEEALPKGNELANLQLLFGFRAKGIATPCVEQHLPHLLNPMEKRSLSDVVTQLTQVTALMVSQIMPALLHRVWHGDLQTNWQQMICQAATPHPAAQIWREG